MFRYVLHEWGVGKLWNVSGDCGMLREVVECYGKDYEHMSGLECFGMFHMGAGSGDCGMFQYIMECYGKLWNVS